MLLPETFCELKAVKPRHHHIENKKIINPEPCVVSAAEPVIADLCLKASALQQSFKGVCQQGFILNYKNFYIYRLRALKF